MAKHLNHRQDSRWGRPCLGYSLRLVVAAAFASLAAASACAFLPWSPTTAWSYTDPLPPPPASLAVWRQFTILYADFIKVHHGVDSEMFRRWVILHGVTDPRDVTMLVALYTWIERGGRI